MRWVWMLALVTACDEDAPCGTDADGDVIPVCVYTDAPGNPEYCPGEQWQSNDDCASCGCGPQGQIVCTDNLFCDGTEDPTGETPEK